jgi:hypothetical protein
MDALCDGWWGMSGDENCDSALLLFHLSQPLPLILRPVDRVFSDLALLFDLLCVESLLAVEVDNIGHQQRPPGSNEWRVSKRIVLHKHKRTLTKQIRLWRRMKGSWGAYVWNAVQLGPTGVLIRATLSEVVAPMREAFPTPSEI